MNFRSLTNENLVFLNSDFKNKEEILNVFIDKLYSEGKITSKEGFKKAVMDREALSATGIGEGLANPHGKLDFVKEPTICIALLKNDMEWETLDDEPVNFVILIAIPMAQAGDTHLEILAKLTTKLADDDFRDDLVNSATAKEVIEKLNVGEEVKKGVVFDSNAKTIVAVTACPAGIAHTYIAAEALEIGKEGKTAGKRAATPKKKMTAGEEAKKVLLNGISHIVPLIVAGGIAGGFIAGYAMKWVKKNVRGPKSLNGFFTFYLYPVMGTLIAGSLMLFVVGKPVAALNTGLTNYLNGLSGGNVMLLGAMVSFDLGGPVNKAAYAFCVGSMANGNFMPYATFASCKMVSAFTTTLAAKIRPHLYSEEEIQCGNSTWILGLAGITVADIKPCQARTILVKIK